MALNCTGIEHFVIDQNSLVGCLGDNCEEEFGEPPKQTRTSVAVMPKVGSELAFLFL